MDEQQKKQTFESAVTRLDIIVAALEKGDAPLNEALTLFEEGTALLKFCYGALDSAEQKVKTLMMKSERPELEETFSENEMPF